MSLVLTDEILWDVDASAREARDAVQLEPSGGPLEGRGRRRKGQEAKKNEAMEKVGRSSHRERGEEPADERCHRHGELPGRIASRWQNVAPGGPHEGDEHDEHRDSRKIKQTEPAPVIPSGRPPHREQGRKRRHGGDQIVFLALARDGIHDEKRQHENPQALFVHRGALALAHAPDHEIDEREREKSRIAEVSEPETVDRIRSGKKPPQIAFAAKLPKILFEDKMLQNRTGLRIEQRPYRKAAERYDYRHRNPQRVSNEKITALHEREPCKGESDRCYQREGFEKARDSKRDTNAHPERESIPVPTPEKQDREGQKHKQGFQLVRQKRPAVLKARIESEKGQAAERAAYAVFCQPLGYETNERRQDKRAQDDGQPQAKEREVASPLGRDDPDPVKKRRLRVLESRRGLQRKPSAARSRQARDLNVGRFVPDMRDVETVERVQIGRQGEDEYPQPPEAHGFVISQWCSLHAQRLDRINAGRTPGRKVAREESGESENHGHRDEYGRVERAHAK